MFEFLLTIFALWSLAIALAFLLHRIDPDDRRRNRTYLPWQDTLHRHCGRRDASR
jgi:hypothetical protein